MWPKEDLCHFCDSLGVEVRKVIVDIEPNDEGGIQGIYQDVLLCEEHCMEQEESNGAYMRLRKRD